MANCSRVKRQPLSWRRWPPGGDGRGVDAYQMSVPALVPVTRMRRQALRALGQGASDGNQLYLGEDLVPLLLAQALDKVHVGPGSAAPWKIPATQALETAPRRRLRRLALAPPCRYERRTCPRMPGSWPRGPPRRRPLDTGVRTSGSWCTAGRREGCRTGRRMAWSSLPGARSPSLTSRCRDRRPVDRAVGSASGRIVSVTELVGPPLKQGRVSHLALADVALP